MKGKEHLDFYSKNKKILDAIFEIPIRSDISCNSFFKMMELLGAKKSNGRSSRINYILGEKILSLPYNSDGMLHKNQVVMIREYLTSIGIKKQDNNNA